MKNQFIELSNVTKVYRQGNNPVMALDHLDLTIAKGEFLTITGKSGCGKSTLINILGGLDSPDEGKIIIDGEDISQMDDDRLTLFRRNRVGIIFQFFNLLPILSVEENIALPYFLKRNSNSPRDKIELLLRKTDLYERRHHKPHQLSGGEMQRVAICRALINDPDLILADEPTGNLDSTSGKQVLEILHRLKDEQEKTILLVTHSQEGATIADRILKMSDGRIF